MTYPERTCCICRGKAPKQELYRVVGRRLCADTEGTDNGFADGRSVPFELVVDGSYEAQSRGGYIHKRAECVMKMAQPGRWERALRLPAGSLRQVQVGQVMGALAEDVLKYSGGEAAGSWGRVGVSSALEGEAENPKVRKHVKD